MADDKQKPVLGTGADGDPAHPELTHADVAEKERQREERRMKQKEAAQNG